MILEFPFSDMNLNAAENPESCNIEFLNHHFLSSVP